MAMHKSLTVAYTPDPDDAFHYCALETARVPWPEGVTATFEHLHIKALNESCRFGRFDVCAISSVFYPEIDDVYVILGSGASVGRDYGPVLGCREDDALESLVGKRVAVPGTSTTGYFLLSYFYKAFTAVPMAFDQVEAAIVAGDVDAGVLIHEGLLNFGEQRIRKMCCLGHRWFAHTGLPLPVGLVVAKRALGLATLSLIENALHASMAYALANRAEAMAFASQFGRGPLSAVREDFVAKFANEDTLLMPADVRLGLSALYTKAHKQGFIDHLPALDIIDPVLPRARAGLVIER
jgi:1,4-dihydroxy-6-naphthoate synthase